MNLWLARPVRSSIGLAIILLGAPFFYYWRKGAVRFDAVEAVSSGA